MATSEPNTARRSRSAGSPRTPVIPRSTSLSNLRNKFRGARDSFLAVRPLMSVREVTTTPKLRPCQNAYFEDGNTPVRKDRDADIFKKHFTNAAACSKVRPGSPPIIVVERDEQISLLSVEEIDEDFQTFKARVDRRNSPTAVLLQAVRRNIEAAPPPRQSLRSTSLVSRERLYAELPKLPTERQIRHDSGLQNELVAVDTKPPPIPPKSKLRSLPKSERLVSGQGIKNEKALSNPQKYRYVLESADKKTQSKTVAFQPSETKKTSKEPSTSADQAKAPNTVQVRRIALKMLAFNLFNDKRSKRSSKTREELDFEDGKTTIYASIHYAREQKAVRENRHPPVQWLHINDDLAADARVTAKREDIRAKVNPPHHNKRAAPMTRISWNEVNGNVRLIGPVEHGALTLGQMWIGGWNKRHKVDSHGRSVTTQHDDESCPCKLYQVHEVISDVSYKYIGIARSAREHKWIVHLAKELPTKVKRDEMPRPTTPKFKIKRKPIPTRAYMEAASRVG